MPADEGIQRLGPRCFSAYAGKPPGRAWWTACKSHVRQAPLRQLLHLPGDGRITLSLPMGLSLLLGNVERLGGSWQRAAQISLYLKPEGQLMTQGQELRDPDRAHARRDRGASTDQQRTKRSKELQEQSGLGEALASELPDNPLAWRSSSVTPKQKSTRTSAGCLASTPGRAAQGVKQAQLDLVWVERLSAILKLGDRFVFGLTVLLVLDPAAGDRQYHSSAYREPPQRDRGDQAGRRYRWLRTPPLPLYGRALRPGRRHPVLGAAGVRPELAERLGGQPRRVSTAAISPSPAYRLGDGLSLTCIGAVAARAGSVPGWPWRGTCGSSLRDSDKQLNSLWKKWVYFGNLYTRFPVRSWQCLHCATIQ